MGVARVRCRLVESERIGKRGVVYQAEIEVETRGRGTYEITKRVDEAVRASRVAAGLCHVFTAHTSASLMICEKAVS